MQIEVQTDDQELATQDQPCPYCVPHSDITPVLSNSLSFDAPQTLALFPQLFYQSPKLLAVWVIPPSAAPPAQA
jgi:hypothetical protein